MTDRHAGYIVTLDRDIREDDAEPLLQTIRLMKGVTDVRPVTVGSEAYIIRSSVDNAWRDSLRALARNGPGSLSAE